MNDLGNKIKLLRKKLNLTQEELAERLGVSFQAVSKWETNATYPDITMFPILANFFDVTTDELLDVDLSKKKARIDAIIAEYDRLSNLGKEKFDYISKAHREYPNDCRILDKYIWMLNYDPNHNGDGVSAHEQELFLLCNRILDECPVDSVRYSALSILGGLYCKKGDLTKALEYARRFPSYYGTAGEERENCYDRGTESWWKCIRSNIYEITGLLMVKFRNCALYADLTSEEKIKLFEKTIKLLDLVYDEEDYGFSHYDLCELNIWISNRYIELENYEKAAEYLKTGLEHGRKYDELPQTTTHTSYLVQNHIFNKSEVSSGFEGNEVKRELDYIDGNDFYDKVRDMEWFKNIYSYYRKYASDSK